jgi:O-antigen/teichoic acid export membrane protein
MRAIAALKDLLRRAGGPGFGSTFARIAAGTAVAQFAGMAIALVVGVVLAQELGPAGLGVYSLAMSTVAVLAIPTEFGLPNYLMREVAAAHVGQDWERLASVLRWCTRAILFSGLGIVALACAAVLVLPVDPAVRLAILAALPLIPLVAQTNARDLALRGMNRQLAGQLPTLVLRPAFFLAALGLTAALSAGPLLAWHAMLLHALAMVFVFVAIALIFSRYAPSQIATAPPLAFDHRAALQAAVPMGMTEGMRVLNGHLAVFFLGLLASTEAVGLFKVADSIGLLCGLPISILNVVAAPQIARLHAANDIERLRRLVSYVGLGMAVGCFGIFVCVALFGEAILAALFGPAFVGAKAPMLILCLGFMLAAGFGPAIVFMNMTGRERTVTQGVAFSFAITLVAGAVAVTFAGAIGAAVANVTGFLVWTVWLWREGRRQTGIDTSLLRAVSELAGLR